MNQTIEKGTAAKSKHWILWRWSPSPWWRWCSLSAARVEFSWMAFAVAIDQADWRRFVVAIGLIYGCLRLQSVPLGDFSANR